MSLTEKHILSGQKDNFFFFKLLYISNKVNSFFQISICISYVFEEKIEEYLYVSSTVSHRKAGK